MADSIPADNSFIRVVDLVKVYRTPAGEFTALKQINVSINQGEFVAVVGKSGSGKSTLVNMMTGIDRPTTGEVWVGDTALHTLNEAQMTRWRGRNLGIIFQFFQLIPSLTLVENVKFAMELNHRYSRRERHERAMSLLKMVEMDHQAHKLPANVSGGQQQRVAIARALANDPPLIVADEPTGSLDSKTAEKIFLLFEDLRTAGKTILVVTHDIHRVKHANRSIVIADGEVINQHIVEALNQLNQEQLAEVVLRITPLIYPAGTTIFRQGEIGDKFYIITEGRVDVILEQPDGSQVQINQLHEGQYFGEMALLGNGRRTSTIRTWNESQVSVVALDEATFDQIVTDSYLLREELTKIMQRRQANSSPRTRSKPE